MIFYVSWLLIKIAVISGRYSRNGVSVFQCKFLSVFLVADVVGNIVYVCALDAVFVHICGICLELNFRSTTTTTTATGGCMYIFSLIRDSLSDYDFIAQIYNEYVIVLEFYKLRLL